MVLFLKTYLVELLTLKFIVLNYLSTYIEKKYKCAQITIRGTQHNHQ